MDPGLRPLSARHARREEADPPARDRRAVDRWFHARSSAVRPHLRGRGQVSVRRGGWLIDLPRTASTIVVGGGVVGAAAAYFLCDRGERDVLVLERDKLGSGTTKGGLGGIRHQFVDELDIRMSQLATAFWRNFEDRTGSRHDFEERGYLFIANTEEGVAQLREPMPLYERMRAAVRMVSRVEIAELVP
ncbi:MAG: FAD-binding oxidoreductase, partial [Chloroflexi bacterium]